MTDKHDALI